MIDREGDIDPFPIKGIEGLCSFMERSGFCTSDANGMRGFAPQDVMAWEQYLDIKLTQNEREAVIILSSNYAVFYTRWNGKPAQDPYVEFKESQERG